MGFLPEIILPTKILPRNFLDSVKRRRAIYYVGRKARFALGSTLGSRYLEGLGSKAHFNDFMLKASDARSVAMYRRGADEFVQILTEALAEAGSSWAAVRSCLEVGCGYGRIVRELRRQLPAGAISVCDLIDEAASFTAAEFGVRKIEVVEKLPATEDEAYDLIFLLSVYTHLPLKAVEMNLARVARLLKPGGVLVFTTHGPASAAQAERYEQYWLDKAALNAELESCGYYYKPYPYYYEDYGLTWFNEEYMSTTVGRVAPALRPVVCHPARLEKHQDVYVYQKLSR